MTQWWLLARARNTTQAVLTLLVITGIGVVLGTRTLTFFGTSTTFAVPWVVLLPVASAAVIGLAARTAVPELERGSARSLAWFRAGHTAAPTTVSAARTTLVTANLHDALTTAAAVRNLLGFTGLALLSATVLGGAQAWLLPAAMALPSMVVGASGGVPHAWAWPLDDNYDVSAGLIGVLLFAVGGAAVALRGTRDATSEIE